MKATTKLIPVLNQKNGTSISTYVRVNDISIKDLYALKARSIWKAFASENFAFWMSCLYLFFEYVRPQSIWSWIDFYPYWARTFVILAFLGWMLESKKSLVWNKITTGIIAFQLVIIISSINAYWPSFAWDNFMQYFNWVVVYLVLTQVVTTQKRFFILFLIFFIASFKLSFFGFRFLTTMGYTSYGIAGPVGYFQNPGELAIQMLMFAPMALFFAIGLKSYLKKWQVLLLYFVPITAALTIIGTNTRGGQVALGVQIVSLILMTKHRFKTLLAVILILMVGFHILPDEQKERFESAGDDKTSIQRILYWKHGWQMIKDHPYLGVGYFNFRPYYSVYHSDDIIFKNFKTNDPLKQAELPHNIFIQVGTDAGFTGLFLFFGLIVLAYWQIRKVQKKFEGACDVFMSNMAKGMNLSLLGYLVAGQFVTVAYYPFLWIHLVFVTVISTIIMKKNI